ncbi:hypothetical protein [Erythrobacter sp. F6033]|uniref:hypothetical protein n=1 Tax=Erythrobacter sp. F6033 TaxID=2926401 RepID=UPI001FF6B7BE|nr:hypothetical protein [Erythrobacter sp. F6033]MCK0127737.1 hypothetical protein [Erythrobacter sp. F6033]
MRIVGDVIDNVFSSFRLVMLLIFGAVMLFGLFMTVGASVVAPQVVDAAAERAERLGERAIEAELEAKRTREMSKDGWGYSEPGRGSGSTYEDGEYVGGWGSDD